MAEVREGNWLVRIDWREPWLSPALTTWVLAAIGFVALMIRILWIQRFGHVIENEGTAFAVLARSMSDGLGYVGNLGDRHTFVPPLYPFLINLLAPLAGGEEMAARCISCTAGMLLVYAAFSIARRLAGVRAGILAAGLYACHGLTLGFSGATYNEGLFFCLLFFATITLLRAVEQGGSGHWIACGLLYGLAYLVRPEAIAYVMLAVVFVLWRWPKQSAMHIAPAAARAGLILLMCVVVIAPYVYWLSTNSGHFRLEGKSDNNGVVNERLASGMIYAEASRGLGPDLQSAGPYLIPDQFEIPEPTHSGIGTALRTVFDDPIGRAVHALIVWVRDPSSGGSPILVLGLIGMTAAFLRKARNIPVALLFFLMTAGYLGLILSVRWFYWDRYLYPLSFFMLVWAAAGISWCVDGLGVALERLAVSAPWQGMLRFIAIGCMAGSILYTSRLTQYAPLFHQSHHEWARTLKNVGLQIRGQSSGHPLVMGYSAVTPYYAGGYLRYLPWLPEGRGADALSFVHRHPPNFIVLRTAERYQVPYIGPWLEGGIPDRCAREILREEESPGQEVVAFAWECPPGSDLGERPESIGREIPAQHSD